MQGKHHCNEMCYLLAKWPKSRDATAMCDAIRIAHPQIASDAKHIFTSDAKIPYVTQ